VPAPDPTEAEEVERIREELARTMALADAGKLDEAISELETLESRASLLRYQPLQAEVKVVLGRVMGKTGQHERAREILDEAAWLGVESGHHLVCAQAWTEMTFLLAARMGDVEGARRAKRAAEAYLSQVGDDPKLARRLLVYSGALALAEQRYDDARKIYEQVLADDPAGSSIHRATLLMNLGSVYVMLGNPDEAVDHYRRAVGMFVEQFGRVHPRVAMGYYNLGIVLMQRGILDDAQMQFELAYDLGKSTLGVDHPQVAETANALGLVALRMGETEKAIAYFEEAVEIANQGKVSPVIAHDYASNVISALTELGRLDEAQERLEALRREMDEAEALPASSEVQWLVLSAQISRKRGDWDAARETVTRAVEMSRKSKDVEPMLRAYAVAELAEVEGHAGNHKAAVGLLREALGPDVVEQIDSLERADFEFQLARHLAASGQQAEAKEQAEAALQRFDDAALFDEAEEIELWLAGKTDG
jgi:serine/threonine-protein kinase